MAVILAFWLLLLVVVTWHCGQQMSGGGGSGVGVDSRGYDALHIVVVFPKCCLMLASDGEGS